MQGLSVRVLGPFAVDGVEETALGSRKGRALLRLLALARGRAVPVDTLVASLWVDSAPARPAEQVTVLVSRLRGVLGRDRVELSDAGYRLRYDALDVDELDDLVAELDRRREVGNSEAAAAVARLALALIRGDPGDGSDEAWASDRVEELRTLIGRARRGAVAALTAAGHPHEAVDVAASMVRADPYDEDALRLLMRAHVAGGRPASALDAYAATATRLAEDLGTDPAPETQALHTAILRGSGTPSAPRPSPHTPNLVGRVAERQRLDTAADGLTTADGPPGESVVLVRGEGGIGKTTLLRAWSAQRVQRGDTVLWVTCGPLDRVVPLDALLAALGAHLRWLPPDRAGAVLGPDAELLGPLLGRVDLPAPGLSEQAGSAVLFAALLRALQRLALSGPLIVVVDDAHLAGPVLAEWLEFTRRRSPGFLVITAVRPGEGTPMPADSTIELGGLDRAEVAVLAGSLDAEDLYRRSGGHPLFVAELITAAAGPREAGNSGAPSTLVAVVIARCAELGEAAAEALRSAAVLGPRVDLDLLAAVLRRPVIDVLADAEAAAARGLLVTGGGGFAFRHELVRQALAVAAVPARVEVLHREAGRVLQARPGADPLEVAEHARLGGDRELAAASLRAAADRAAARYDHAGAEALLDEALEVAPDLDAWLQRARVRTRRGDYAGALADVDRASAAGAAALEVAAWAAYYDRRFAAAAGYADDGELAAEDPVLRARCLTIGGRTRHAAGDLAGAQRLLTAAVDLAVGADRVTASAWLGVVHAHQSRTADALRLMSAAARAHTGVEHTSATMHALLFTGHVQAAAGQPAAALDTFERYTAQVEHRQVPRFAGRGINFTGWVLRNLGAVAEGVDLHRAVLEVGTAEVAVAARQDLAEERLVAGDLAAAADWLADAGGHLKGDLVFGWRLAFRQSLLQARIALELGNAEAALGVAADTARAAEELGVPRYACPARLVTARARQRLGLPVDRDAVATDLDVAQRTMAVEAWWWAGEIGAQFAEPRWVDRSEQIAAELAHQAGDRSDVFVASARRRVEQWRSVTRSG